MRKFWLTKRDPYRLDHMAGFLKPGSTITAGLHFFKMLFLLILTGCFLHSPAVGQCSFSGLNASYYVTDGPVTLYEETAGGTFSGPGVSGNTFDPAVAGVGTHTIQYINNDLYSVNTSGAFSPYISGSSWITSNMQGVDDGVSAAVNIGFAFNFFGTEYNQLYISSNGNVAFAPYSEPFFIPKAIPALESPNNIIALVRTDLDPSASGGDEIKYKVIGTDPNRIFVLSYNNLERYGTITGYLITTQLKLFESTNIIEIHTTENSATYAHDTSLQGIENATGTIGYTLPGRNDEFWRVNDDFVSFIPCTDSQVVTVYGADAGSEGSICGKDGSNPFTFSAVLSADTGTWTQQSGPGTSTFGDVNVSNTTVTVDTYGSYVYRWTELSGAGSDYDEVTVNFYEPTVADAGPATAEESDSTIQLEGIQSVMGSTASWSVTAGNAPDITFSNSNIFNPTATSTSYGTYTFTLTETNGVCVDTDDIIVTLNIMDANYTVKATAGANGYLDGATPSPQSIDPGESTTFTFSAAANHHLTSITGCGVNYINTSNGVTSHTVTTEPITGDCTVSAAFGIDHYSLSTTITGKGTGYVNIDSTGEDCIDHCTRTYPYGTLITLMAMAVEGHEFDGWGGDCEGVADICTLIMDNYRSATASFSPESPEFSLILWYSSFIVHFAHQNDEQKEDN